MIALAELKHVKDTLSGLLSHSSVVVKQETKTTTTPVENNVEKPSLDPLGAVPLEN